MKEDENYEIKTFLVGHVKPQARNKVIIIVCRIWRLGNWDGETCINMNALERYLRRRRYISVTLMDNNSWKAK